MTPSARPPAFAKTFAPPATAQAGTPAPPAPRPPGGLPARPPAASPPGSFADAPRPRTWILFAFMGLLYTCQVALLFEALAPARVVFRGIGFVASIGLLVALPAGGPMHPAVPAAAVVLGILTLSLGHPTGNWPAAPAQFAMHLAIIAPIFWATRLRPDPVTFRRLMLMVWAFQSASAAVGILQVYYPGQFQPAVSTAILGQRDYIEGLKIQLDDGTLTVRPMGLTDVPGGAATAGLYAILFGVGVLLERGSGLFLRSAAVAGILTGFACMYLCQVRSVLVMTIFSLTGMGVALGMRGQFARATGFAAVALAAIFAGYAWALTLAPQSVERRLASLLEEDPNQVYYKNRGVFFEHTVNVLMYDFPAGSGLGRWGMMYGYFGDKENADAYPLWAEIQWTGWLYDGGIALMLAYPVALFLTGMTALRVALSSKGTDGPGGFGPRPGPKGVEVWVWAIVLGGYDLGFCATTFNYAIFNSQFGLEFWLLNAAMFSAFASESAAPAAVAARGDAVPLAPPVASPMPRPYPSPATPVTIGLPGNPR